MLKFQFEIQTLWAPKFKRLMFGFQVAFAILDICKKFFVQFASQDFAKKIGPWVGKLNG